MRIQFERSGGFAGMRFAAAIDVDTLSAEDAKALREMVGAADFFNLPPIIRSSSASIDSFQYKISIEKGAQSHTVETGDNSAPASLRPLLRRLTVLSRSAHK